MTSCAALAPSSVAPLPPRRRWTIADRRLARRARSARRDGRRQVLVAAPDSPGVLSRSTPGVLALHSLDVRSASIHTHAGMAVNLVRVSAGVRESSGRRDPAEMTWSRSLGVRFRSPRRLAAKERAMPAATWPASSTP